jgi:hypothetical protein
MRLCTSRLAGKGSLAVRAGVPAAHLIAAICTVLAAAAAAIMLAHAPRVAQVFAGIEYGVLPHVVVLLVLLAAHLQRNAGARLIDA